MQNPNRTLTTSGHRRQSAGSQGRHLVGGPACIFNDPKESTQRSLGTLLRPSSADIVVLDGILNSPSCPLLLATRLG